jgi:hypothetical protein
VPLEKLLPMCGHVLINQASLNCFYFLEQFLRFVLVLFEAKKVGHQHKKHFPTLDDNKKFIETMC